MPAPYPPRAIRLLALAAFTLAGCRATESPKTTYVAQDRIMPPNTILLSTMMSDLASDSRFFDNFIDGLDTQPKTGPSIFSPKMKQAFRDAMYHDWHALDRFPGWQMADINPIVDLSGNLDQTLAHLPAQPLTTYIDLGDYPLNRTQPVDLNRPSSLPGFTTNGLVTPLGEDVTRGDSPNPAIAPMHSESQRLADLLNRLALNGRPGTQLPSVAPITATLEGHSAQTPEDLIRALIATGHQVTVADARYFANFGHLHYEGNDVMMPFWVNVDVWIPGQDRQLLVPVAHAEYEWFVRGPKINADVAFYFGIDGKAEFRTMDQLDQPWVMGRHAHEYRNADAVEVTRLTGLLALAYARIHLAHPSLPFGGYYTLGVCQDGVSAIEKKMTGAVSLFPNTVNIDFFNDSRDAEINRLLAAIPNDRDAHRPELARVFGSLPTTNLAAITIPGLAPDLEAVQQAWRNNTLRYRRQPPWQDPLEAVAILAAVFLALWLRWRIRRLKPAPTP